MTFMQLLQWGRLFLLAMLVAWAVIIVALVLIGRFTVRKVEEIEENTSEQKNHKLAA